MSDDMNSLKIELRAVAVSCPTKMDVWTLVRDYRRMVGKTLPFVEFGYKEPVDFLKEMFSDCFVFTGPAANPVITLIVPESLKHLEKFVQKQKPDSTLKFKAKQQSIPKPKMPMQSNNCFVNKHIPTGSSIKKVQLNLNTLKYQLLNLIAAEPRGLWCSDLMPRYKEKYKCEMKYAHLGFSSVVSLVSALQDVVKVIQPVKYGDYLLRDRRKHYTETIKHIIAPSCSSTDHIVHKTEDSFDSDDALPGIDYDPEVFPADCMRPRESIPPVSLEDCRPGAMLEVIVGEVYSPSHFWLLRLGDERHMAMERLMDDMTQYYRGSGADRVLAPIAARLGNYCAVCYAGDWHRALVVRVLDNEHVKVRHVDYGTVARVRRDQLKPLRRCWASLPAQAFRARLAGVRPPAMGPRWQPSAARHFLNLVYERPLIANVVAVDPQEDVVETLLIDTSDESDVSVSDEMVRDGYAAPRDDALRTEQYERYPSFEALESGATPNMSEIHTYLQDGIELEFVEEFRRHVLHPDVLSAVSVVTPAVLPPKPSEADVPIYSVVERASITLGLATPAVVRPASCEADVPQTSSSLPVASARLPPAPSSIPPPQPPPTYPRLTTVPSMHSPTVQFYPSLCQPPGSLPLAPEYGVVYPDPAFYPSAYMVPGCALPVPVNCYPYKFGPFNSPGPGFSPM